MKPPATWSWRKSLLTRLFVRYGDGARLWQPITRKRYFNTIAWIIIVVGVVAWTADLIVYYFFW